MKKGFLLICFGLFGLMAFSQTNVVEFLKGGKADANKLFQAYLEPYAFALGDGLNNGWYNSAATHKLFGFDLTVTVSGIQIPEEAKTFDISKLGLTNMTVTSGGNIAPTVAGADVLGPRMLVKDAQGNSIASFNTPNGVALDMVPVPMAQVGFGLLPHTDVIGRYVPDMKYNNGGDEMKVGFWGVGVKHNFMEWIPFLKALPFDASLFGSYSEVNAQSALNSLANSTIEIPNDGNQFLKVNTKTTKFGLVVSKKISVLTVFAGLGQSTSKSNVDLIGKYTIVTKLTVAGQEFTSRETLTDPVAIPFDTSNISMDLGIRLKLAFFSLFGSVNKSQYTSYNAGISLGMR
jgi:hypothetical protein